VRKCAEDLTYGWPDSEELRLRMYKKHMPRILKGLLDLRFDGFLRDRPALQLALSHPFFCLRAHNTFLPN
jgi:hypothetical protein